MEILRQGDKNSVECFDRGTMLRFKARDISMEHIDPAGPYELEGYDRFTIECPACDTVIDVTDKITVAIGSKVLKLERQRQQDDYYF